MSVATISVTATPVTAATTAAMVSRLCRWPLIPVRVWLDDCQALLQVAECPDP